MVPKDIQEIYLHVEEVHEDYVAEHPEAAEILAAAQAAEKQRD